MSSEVEDVFQAVLGQALEISVRWKLYRQLFDSGPENINLLNESGSFVFGLLQRLIIYDVVLSLARLTDPTKSGAGGKRHENASIENLILKAKPALSSTASSEVEVLRAKLSSFTRDIRIQRDKVLAHTDLKHALKAEKLPDIAYDDIEGAAITLQRLITILGSAIGHQIQSFDVSFTFGTDGKKLLSVLRRGQTAQESTFGSS